MKTRRKYISRRKNSKPLNKTRHNRKRHDGGNDDESNDEMVPDNMNNLKDICPDANKMCHIFDKQLSQYMWKTCIHVRYSLYNKNKSGLLNNENIRYHILYLTPRNVIFKSVETIQIPEFFVNLNGQVNAYKIKIGTQHATCFLKICGEWYAILRLSGKTLNTNYLARTERNNAYYRLKNFNINEETGEFSFSPGTYTMNTNRSIIPYVLVTSNSPEVELNSDSYENVYKNTKVNGNYVFHVLQRFRNEKILANQIKRTALRHIVNELYE